MRILPFDDDGAPEYHYAITINENLRFGTAETSYTVDGHSFPPYGAANLTNIQYLGDGSPSNADVRILAIPGGLVEPGQAALGILDGLSISIKVFDARTPESGGFELIPNAIIGSAKEDGDGIVVIAAIGPLSRARAPMARQYSTVCPWKLGDDNCKIPILVPDITRAKQYYAERGTRIPSLVYGRVKTGTAGDNSDYANFVYRCTVSGITHATVQPTYPVVVGNSVVDGTATFITEDAWVRYAFGEAINVFQVQFTGLPDPLADGIPEWFVLGNLIPRSGPLAGREIPIRAFDSVTFIVTMAQPFAMSNFPTDTQFDIYRGCDKLKTTCHTIFDNIKNFGGIPTAPGSDLVTGRG